MVIEFYKLSVSLRKSFKIEDLLCIVTITASGIYVIF